MSLPPRTPQVVSPAAFPVMVAIVFISLMGFGVVIPLLPFFGAVFQAEAWQVTLLFAGYSAGGFAGELYWGPLSDRIGRRPVLIATILGIGLSYIALAFAPGIWVAILARFVCGFFSGNFSVIQGYVVDVSPPEKVAARIGLIGAAFSAGLVVGPSLGGLLARPDLGAAGFRPPFEAAAALCVLGALGVIFLVKEARVPDLADRPRTRPLDAVFRSLRDPVLRNVVGANFLMFVTFTAAWALFGLWGAARFGWGPRETGLVLGVSGVASSVTQALVSGRMVRRFGAVTTIVSALALLSASLLLLALSPWPWAGAAFWCLALSGNALVVTAVMSMVAAASPPELQGANLGAANATGSMGRVVGPIAGGLFYTLGGPTAPMVIAGLGVLPAIWLIRQAAAAQRAAGLSRVS